MAPRRTPASAAWISCWMIRPAARMATAAPPRWLRSSCRRRLTPSTGPTIEQPFAIDGPTVEQPALGIDDTLAGKLGARRAPFGGTDQTAELSIDDLGLDLGKLEATGSNLLDDSQLMPSLGSTDATGSDEQVPKRWWLASTTPRASCCSRPAPRRPPNCCR